MAFTLQIGASARDFNLPGADGKKYSLSTFKDAKVLIVVFSCNHCPAAIGTQDRIIKLARDYAPKGVALVMINSNDTEFHPDDSFPDMVTRAKEKHFPFPYIHDQSQQVAKAYGTLRTPHFFVFDKDRKLRYTGRFDDVPYINGEPTTRELLDAVDAILAGKKPSVELTNPMGCNVKWRGQEAHWMPADACDLVIPGKK